MPNLKPEYHQENKMDTGFDKAVIGTSHALRFQRTLRNCASFNVAFGNQR
jgi:hypothetical protein